MTFTIQCPCGFTMQAHEKLIGTQIRCDDCQSMITVEKPVRKKPTICHEIDYEVFGDDLQLVEIELDPEGDVHRGSRGHDVHGGRHRLRGQDGRRLRTNQGFFGKLWMRASAAITGESIFLTHFTNKGKANAASRSGSPYPGKIIPVNLMDVSNTLICQKDAFLCAALGTKLGIAFQKKLGVGFFGGEGFILQKLEGDGMAFMHACGCIIERKLKDGETLRVDTGCVVAFTKDVDYDIQKAGGLKSMIFGGEGLFLATLQARDACGCRACRSRGWRSASAGRLGAARRKGPALGGLGSMLSGD